MKHIIQLLIILSILLLFITSCTQEQKVDKSKSNYYYYSKNKDKILYITHPSDISGLWVKYTNEVDADVNSFTVLGTIFAKDKDHFFLKSNIITNVDYASCYYDSVNNVLKDKDHVLVASLKGEKNPDIIEDADPKSFQRIHSDSIDISEWTKDKNYYFFKYKKVNVDYSTFTLISRSFAYDKTHIYYGANDFKNIDSIRHEGDIKVLSSKIIYDKNQLYFQQYPLNEGILEIQYKDINTFKIYKDTPSLAFRIDNNIFWGGRKIDTPDFDVDSYEILDNSYYGKDKNNIYYQDKIVEGVDRNSFQVVFNKDKASIYGKDKNRAYYREEVFPYTVDLNSFEINEKTKSPQDKNYSWKKLHNKPWEKTKR